uniref:Uncharacterized protein n=1 Tax=Rhizophora mucronata TaxID=61149 RepID=A0A2P2NQE3_RHIMU
MFSMSLMLVVPVILLFCCMLLDC